MKKLFEVLAPTIYGDTMKPIKTKHHKNWDKKVVSIAGGMTLFKPARGNWVHENKDFEERVIPVRIMCEESDIGKIIDFTLCHYRQIAVMYYVISNECYIVYKK